MLTVTETKASDRWEGGWRGRWIWDRAPDESYWWRLHESAPHFTYLRKTFRIDRLPDHFWSRVTCDSRYVLYLNGEIVGRGPIRGEPEFLGWDEIDLARYLQLGPNVIVALCHYYGAAGPWWIPASPLGTLGRGSFCFESAPDCGVDVLTDNTWQALPAPWIPSTRRGMHSVPPEVIDGRNQPIGLHDANASIASGEPVVTLSGKGHGTVLDRPPAAPYMSPMRRPIPMLESRIHRPTLVAKHRIECDVADDPSDTWVTVEQSEAGDRMASVWDAGGVMLGHVRLVVSAEPNEVIDVVAGEDLDRRGLPEVRPRNYAARYVSDGRPHAELTFFDPVGLRFIGIHHSVGVEAHVEVEETTYPRPTGAEWNSHDSQLSALWKAGLRTVDVCSTDAFLDCPGREQRAWVADSYPQILVSLVTNPDLRLVRHHLDLTARSRLASGLLAGAAGCDFARIGFTMPEYSLHWIRALAAYFHYTGDEEFVRRLLPVAERVLERYEEQRGPSGLLENWGGWVFLDWAQVGRDVITGTHDALHAAALVAYGTLPGASDMTDAWKRTRSAFEALWDEERGVYVDAIGPDGPYRRVSQHTNGAALLAGLVPDSRVTRVIDRISNPALMGGGGTLVTTPTTVDWRERPDAHDLIPIFQYLEPEDFSPEADMVRAQPWFCRFLHEAYFSHGRRDLILASLREWKVSPEHGTLGEFWDAEPGAASRCHGWAASPTFDLTSYILGVRPAEPGFTTAMVDPYLADLREVSGRVSTRAGWLTVKVGDGSIELDIPEGMIVNCAEQELEAGHHELEFAGSQEGIGIPGK